MTPFGAYLIVLAVVLSVGGVGLHLTLLQRYQTRLADSPSMPPASRPIDPDEVKRNTVPLSQSVERITSRNPTARAMVAELKETGDFTTRHSDEGMVPRRA